MELGFAFEHNIPRLVVLACMRVVLPLIDPSGTGDTHGAIRRLRDVETGAIYFLCDLVRFGGYCHACSDVHWDNVPAVAIVDPNEINATGLGQPRLDVGSDEISCSDHQQQKTRGQTIPFVPALNWKHHL